MVFGVVRLARVALGCIACADTVKATHKKPKQKAKVKLWEQDGLWRSTGHTEALKPKTHNKKEQK